jgi:predicted HTH transcriptional regulator
MEDKVQKALKKGPKTNKELREELKLSTDNYDSKLDQTLQKLRKQGKLRVINGRWSLVSFDICPTCEGRGWVKA